MTDPAGPLPMTVINAVLLADGTWHPVGSGLFLFYNPQFINPVTGAAETLGGPWIQFTGADGITYGVPADAVRGVQWTPPPAGP